MLWTMINGRELKPQKPKPQVKEGYCTYYFFSPNGC